VTLRPLLGRHQCLIRLQLIFPRAAFDAVLANPLAAAAVAAMIYVDAVVPESGPTDGRMTWARPSTCLWMSDAAFAHSQPQERAAWRAAALRGKRAVADLLASWGASHEPWYGDNSRETLRDETFPAWLDHGAVRVRSGVPTTSSRPRWGLTEGFADLFGPNLDEQALVAAIDAWRNTHMGPGDRLRIRTMRQRDRQLHAVSVTLPNGEVRLLEPGDASRILRGVIEQWAPARLSDPVVVTVSEPGEKVYIADGETLRALRLSVDASTLLPDALIVDIGTSPPAFWVIEAVASNGPVTEDRRRQLIRWAEEQRIPAESCRFLSAFLSRHAPASRRRLKDLAVGTYAWYADEPTRELAWYVIGDAPPQTDGQGSHSAAW
jgi:hypothetical protein